MDLTADGEEENAARGAVQPLLDTTNSQRRANPGQDMSGHAGMPHAGSATIAAVGPQSACALAIGEKRAREGDADSDDPGDHCIICHEEFVNSGEHRVISLGCGHLFGDSCIRKWLASRKSCPSCNKKATRKDIRPIFCSRLVLRDTSELEAAKKELDKERQQRLQLEDKLRRRQQDLVRSQVENKNLEADVRSLRSRIKALEHSRGVSDSAVAFAAPGMRQAWQGGVPFGGVSFGAGPGAGHASKYNLARDSASMLGAAGKCLAGGGCSGRAAAWGGMAAGGGADEEARLEREGRGARCQSDGKDLMSANGYKYDMASSGGAPAWGAGRLDDEAELEGKAGVQGSTAGTASRAAAEQARVRGPWMTVAEWKLNKCQVLEVAEREACLLVSCCLEATAASGSGRHAPGLGGEGGGSLLAAAGAGAGYSLCKINYLTMGRELMRPALHDKPITDCKVERQRGEVVLTCSMDMTARLTRIDSCNPMSRWTLSKPLWSCCWDAHDENIFFCGGTQNSLYLIDTRQDGAIRCIEGMRAMPTHSLAAMPASQASSDASTRRLVVGGTLAGVVCWSFGPDDRGREVECRELELEVACSQGLRCTSLSLLPHTGSALASFTASQPRAADVHVIFGIECIERCSEEAPAQGAAAAPASLCAGEGGGLAGAGSAQAPSPSLPPPVRVRQLARISAVGGRFCCRLWVVPALACPGISLTGGETRAAGCATGARSSLVCQGGRGQGRNLAPAFGLWRAGAAGGDAARDAAVRGLATGRGAEACRARESEGRLLLAAGDAVSNNVRLWCALSGKRVWYGIALVPPHTLPFPCQPRLAASR